MELVVQEQKICFRYILYKYVKQFLKRKFLYSISSSSSNIEITGPFFYYIWIFTVGILCFWPEF